MEQNTSPQLSMADVLARVGVVVDNEGKARARRRLAEADAHANSDPAGSEAFRARLRQGSTAA